MKRDKFKMVNPFTKSDMSKLPAMTLPIEEYNELIGAIRKLHDYGIFWPNTGGFTVDGKDYISIDFVSSPYELKRDLDIINTFFKKNCDYKENLL